MYLSELSPLDLQRIRDDRSIQWLRLCDDLGVEQHAINMANPPSQLLNTLIRYGLQLDVFMEKLALYPSSIKIYRYLYYILNNTWNNFPMEDLKQNRIHLIFITNLLKPLPKKIRKNINDFTCGDFYDYLVIYDQQEIADKFKKYIETKVVNKIYK